MAEDKKIVNPPAIVDSTDNDQPSEYIQIRKTVGYPDKDVSEAIIDKEIKYAKSRDTKQTLKAVLLAIVGLVYTYILLAVR